ncbi:MAG: CBS and ACT domain-containing protein [Pseudomonadota bacterium]
MLVVNWMSTRLVSIDPDASLGEALQLTRDYRVSRVVVVENGKLVGILTDRDLKRADASEAAPPTAEEIKRLHDKVKVRDIMTPNPYTAHIHETLEEAALTMLQRKVSGLPVVDDDDNPVAVITQSDVFRALISLTGVTQGGVQFSLEMEDVPGSLIRVADVIRENGGRVVAILQSYDRVAPGWRRLFIRVKGLDHAQLGPLKEQLKSLGHLRYLVDSQEHSREIFPD